MAGKNKTLLKIIQGKDRIKFFPVQKHASTGIL